MQDQASGSRWRPKSAYNLDEIGFQFVLLTGIICPFTPPLPARRPGQDLRPQVLATAEKSGFTRGEFFTGWRWKGK